MPKVVALFVRNLDSKKPPFVEPEYNVAYQEYFLAMREAGLEPYFTTNNASYLGKGRFEQAWTIDRLGTVEDFKPIGPITADIVFDKGGFAGQDVVVVTDPRNKVLYKKDEMYRQFGHYQPFTKICDSPAELTAAIAEIPGDIVVVKNPEGNGGRQVYIDRKADLIVPASETYPLLVQEFVDLSGGIPGLAEGVHDLRVILVGNTIAAGLVRQAAPGKWHANMHQGGTERLIAPAEIPPEVVKLSLEIDAQLQDLPRYYAIDFAKGKQGWILMELNAKPGIAYEERGPKAYALMNTFIDYLQTLT